MQCRPARSIRPCRSAPAGLPHLIIFGTRAGNVSVTRSACRTCARAGSDAAAMQAGASGPAMLVSTSASRSTTCSWKLGACSQHSRAGHGHALHPQHLLTGGTRSCPSTHFAFFRGYARTQDSVACHTVIAEAVNAYYFTTHALCRTCCLVLHTGCRWHVPTGSARKHENTIGLWSPLKGKQRYI